MFVAGQRPSRRRLARIATRLRPAPEDHRRRRRQLPRGEFIMLSDRSGPPPARQSPRPRRHPQGRAAAAAREPPRPRPAVAHRLRLAARGVVGHDDRPGCRAFSTASGVFLVSVLVVWLLYRLEFDYFLFPALAGFMVIGPADRQRPLREEPAAGGGRARNARLDALRAHAIGLSGVLHGRPAASGCSCSGCGRRCCSMRCSSA